MNVKYRLRISETDSRSVSWWSLVQVLVATPESGAGSHSLTDNLTITIKIAAGHSGHAKSRAKTSVHLILRILILFQTHQQWENYWTLNE